MKITLVELRAIIRNVINEMYMSPKNLRGIGPEIDKEPKYNGDLTVDQVLRWHPDAAQELVKLIKKHTPKEEQGLSSFGKYPKDILINNEWNFVMQDKLIAIGPPGTFEYDSSNKKWLDISDENDLYAEF